MCTAARQVSQVFEEIWWWMNESLNISLHLPEIFNQFKKCKTFTHPLAALLFMSTLLCIFTAKIFRVDADTLAQWRNAVVSVRPFSCGLEFACSVSVGGLSVSTNSAKVCA